MGPFNKTAIKRIGVGMNPMFAQPETDRGGGGQRDASAQAGAYGDVETDDAGIPSDGVREFLTMVAGGDTLQKSLGSLDEMYESHLTQIDEKYAERRARLSDNGMLDTALGGPSRKAQRIERRYQREKAGAALRHGQYRNMLTRGSSGAATALARIAAQQQDLATKQNYVKLAIQNNWHDPLQVGKMQAFAQGLHDEVDWLAKPVTFSVDDMNNISGNLVKNILPQVDPATGEIPEQAYAGFNSSLDAFKSMLSSMGPEGDKAFNLLYASANMRLQQAENQGYTVKEDYEEELAERQRKADDQVLQEKADVRAESAEARAQETHDEKKKRREGDYPQGTKGEEGDDWVRTDNGYVYTGTDWMHKGIADFESWMLTGALHQIGEEPQVSMTMEGGMVDPALQDIDPDMADKLSIGMGRGILKDHPDVWYERAVSALETLADENLTHFLFTHLKTKDYKMWEHLPEDPKDAAPVAEALDIPLRELRDMTLVDVIAMKAKADPELAARIGVQHLRDNELRRYGFSDGPELKEVVGAANEATLDKDLAVGLGLE